MNTKTNDKADQLIVSLAYEQLRWIGIPEEDLESTVRNDPEWYSTNAWPSKEMEMRFREYAISRIRKELKMTKKYAEREFSWWNLTYGLRSFSC
jgi:hypothetical protein